MPWQNFSIWRGRLPHWRADDVTYYVTFRHRRDLSDRERDLLLRGILRSEGRQLDFLICCVLPGETEMLFRVGEGPSGDPYELSKVIEKAKTKAGRLIMKQTEERWPPFYDESYDRIVRDDAELEERWQAIFDSPVTKELVEDPAEWDALWVADAPTGE